MFSYKAQMDEPMDDDQVSLPHQQSFSSLKTDSDYIYQVCFFLLSFQSEASRGVGAQGCDCKRD